MATKDGRAQIWYADDSGNVTGYTESVGEIAGTIIDAYNEHFGTDIQIWTPETITLQVGGTVPNWNAYEKIELQRQKIAANIAGAAPNDAYMIGEIAGKSFTILVGENGGCNTKSDGLVIAYSGPTAQNSDTVIRILGNYGLEVESVYNEIVNYEIGTYIPNWSEYEIIG